MKRLFQLRSLVVMIAILATALGISMAGAASMESDITEIPSCPYCGMDRQKFGHTRIYIVYDDGSKLGTCSIHCAAADMAVHLDKAPKSIQVGDFNSKKLIDAEKAYWVLGGDMQGVMTKRAKWAFESQKDAEAFIAQHGGTLANLDDAMRSAFEDMYDDTKMIIERRKMKRMKMEQEKMEKKQ